ncbi:MAG: ATP-dependent Clp protease ATP-binding subunit [Clostridia bacterium]|nr:ATP-dependent Clp protease ATP-binding subunit [Clostridia bacterium]
MKSKNILKKLLSNLLCVSTMAVSTAYISANEERPLYNGEFSISILKNEEWTPGKLMTVKSLDEAERSGLPYKICSSRGCNTFHEMIPEKKPLKVLKSVFSIANGTLDFISRYAPALFYGVAAFALFKDVLKNIKEFIFGNKNYGEIDEVRDPIEAIARLDKHFEAIKGQDKAKAEIRKFVLNVVEEKNQRARGLSKKKGAYIIYLVGASGVGKSTAAECIAIALNGEQYKAYIIEPSDIDKESKKASVVDQLFGMRTKKVQMNEIYEKSPLIKQLEATPNMVLIINEFDKIPDVRVLEEKIRTIIDHGYINVNGDKTSCSNLTIIITSNESIGSVEKTEHQDDGTGSRTKVEHDKAFLNRLKIVEFQNLNAKDYKQIAKPQLENLQQRYFNDYNVLVTFDDELLDKLANLVEEKNQGARPIQGFVDAINDKLLNTVILDGSKDKSYVGKAVKVSLERNGEEYEFALSNDVNYEKVLQIPLNSLKDMYSSEYNMGIEISDEAINVIAEFMKRSRGNAGLAIAFVQALNEKIMKSIILKDKKKKSYIGKSFEFSLNKQLNWEFKESDPRKQKGKTVEENEPLPETKQIVEEHATESTIAV